MFGDNLLLGNYDLSIDPKGRLTIPSHLNAETGEKLGLAYGEEYKQLLVMTFKTFKELYDRLEAANKKEVLDQDPKLIEQMARLIGYVSVDKQRRIQVPKYVLQRTGLEGEVHVEGRITCLAVSKKTK